MLLLIGSLISLGDLYDLDRTVHRGALPVLRPTPPPAPHTNRVGHSIQSKTISAELLVGHGD